MNSGEIQVFLSELMLWAWNKLNEGVMVEIFTDFPGKDLWAKYKELDMDFLKWFAVLDLDNRVKLAEYLDKIGILKEGS